MAGVSIPKRQSNSGALLSLAGAGVGALAGGPAGASVGMNVGGALGGMSQKPSGPEPIETGAISRRMQQLDQSPLRQIRESIDSLKYVEDPQMRMQLAAPLVKADMAARRQV